MNTNRFSERLALSSHRQRSAFCFLAALISAICGLSTLAMAQCSNSVPECGESFPFQEDCELPNGVVVPIGGVVDASCGSAECVLSGSIFPVATWSCDQEPAGTPCLDGACGAGVCDGSHICCADQSLACDDDNPCTTDTCDVTTGECSSSTVAVETCVTVFGFTECVLAPAGVDEVCVDTPLGQICVDEFEQAVAACGDDGTCATGACQADICVSAAEFCDDDNGCTLDTCDDDFGCNSAPFGKCDDGNPCTFDVCAEPSGSCFNGSPLVETCAEINGLPVCQLAPYQTEEFCVDNPFFGDDFCTTTFEQDPIPCPANGPCEFGVCDALECVLSTVDCDDGDPCTADSCDPAAGCVHTQAADCDDGSPCTDDSCDPETGECVHSPALVETCGTAFGITECILAPLGIDEACVDVGGFEFCTEDFEQALLGCGVGGSCTTGVCDGALCVTPEEFCDDGDNCTIDECDDELGCVHDGSSKCDDGNPCTFDICVLPSGSCVSGPPLVQTCGVINGANICKLAPYQTDEICVNNPFFGDDFCTSDTVQEVLTCGEPTACSEFVCDTLECVELVADCPPTNACFAGSCDPDAGCVQSPVVCDDGDACTTDSCDPDLGCEFAEIQGCGLVISSVSPSAVEPSTQRTLTIVGSPFDASLSVVVEGSTVLASDAVSAEEAQAIVLVTDVPGAYDVEVQNAAGGAAALTEALTVSESYCAPLVCGSCDADLDCLDGDPCTVDRCLAGTCVATEGSACCEPYDSCETCEVAGDIDLSGGISISDVQCSILANLWFTSGKLSASPGCLQARHTALDLNCDAAVNVSDVLLTIQLTLNGVFDAVVDVDQNGCHDACE